MEHLKQVEKEFVEICEKHFRAPLSYTVSYEQYPYPNIHLLIASSVILDAEWMRQGFKYGFGDVDSKGKAIVRHFKVDVDIKGVYDTEGAQDYSLKELNFSNIAEWDVRNMEYFFKPPANAQERRRLRRHNDRLRSD